MKSSLTKNLKRAAKKLLELFGLRITKSRHLRKGVQPVKVGNFEILFGSTSDIPRLYQRYPLYSMQLGRIVLATLGKYPEACLVDIGANVGDTVAIVKSARDIPILCIEGDSYCFSLLQQNIKQFQNVSAHKLYLGEKNERINAVLYGRGSNTAIVPTTEKGSTEVSLSSLDDFLAKNPDQGSFRIIKIDAEGFDPKIIRGGLNYLRSVKPILFFEYNRKEMDRIGEDQFSIFGLLLALGYESILFYDPNGWLMLHCTMSSMDVIRQLHDYLGGSCASMFYLDICTFHKQDADLAMQFISEEENFRHQYRRPKSLT